MGLNYCFVPRKYSISKLNKIEEAYTEKLDSLIAEYVQEFNSELDAMTSDVLDLFTVDKIPEDKYDWYSSPHLVKSDLVELHICKISMGWKPLFEQTKYYSSTQELKQFYETHKDRIKIEDEYQREIELDDLLKDVKDRYNNKDNKSHIDENADSGCFYYKDKYHIDEEGFEWYDGQFS